MSTKGWMGYAPFHEAAICGKVDVVAFFVSNGADVNVENEYGETPLYLAVKHNKSVEVIEFLIANGASVNVKNNDGMTPLDVAKQWENTAIIEYFTSGKIS